MSSAQAPREAVHLPVTTPARAAELLVEQAIAFADQLEGLRPEEWARPTECAPWTVRDVAAHVAGALEEGARLRVMVRHLLAARRRSAGVPQVDALNAAQVADRAGRSGPEIVREIRLLAPRAARARRRAPSVVRRRKIGTDDLPPDATFGYLFDVIYQRDLWMHRVDVARATDRPLLVRAADGEVVEQVVRDLSRFTQGPPWLLEVTGAVDGRWVVGSGSPVGEVRADTVELLRSLSGRGDRPTLVVTGDPEVESRVLAARVVF